MKPRLIVGILTPLRGDAVLLYQSGGTVYRADTNTPVCYRVRLRELVKLSPRVQQIRPQWRPAEVTHLLPASLRDGSSGKEAKPWRTFNESGKPTEVL